MYSDIIKDIATRRYTVNHFTGGHQETMVRMAETINALIDCYNTIDTRSTEQTSDITDLQENVEGWDTIVDTLRSEIETLRKENESIKTEHASTVDALRKENESIKTEHASTIDTLRSENEALRKENESIKSRQDSIESTVNNMFSELRNEIDGYKKELDALKTRPVSPVASVYKPPVMPSYPAPIIPKQKTPVRVPSIYAPMSYQSRSPKPTSFMAFGDGPGGYPLYSNGAAPVAGNPGSFPTFGKR
jgi:FtsZ-binding cell division protein ZapB